MNKQTVTIMDSALIQKSEPLRKMKDIPYTLTQLKLIDLYLSCIDISSDTRQTLILRKSDYRTLCGEESADWRSVNKNIECLSDSTVKLTLRKNGKETYTEVKLFDPVVLQKEKYGGSALLITCSEEAKDYFYCLHKYQYTKYKVMSVMPFRSKYAYLLFVYVNAMRQNGLTHIYWETSVDKLRDDILDLDKQDAYKDFGTFRRSVLEVAVKEINEKTFYNLNYDLVKKGKNVVAIQFTFLPKENKSMDLCTNK